MENIEPQIIKTIGEHGEEIMMKLQEIVTINEQDYALLSIVEDENEVKSDEETELVVMKMIKTQDECSFEIIESDEEFNEVVKAINEDEDDE